MDSLVAGFFTHFNRFYEGAIQLDLNSLSLQEQIGLFNSLFEVITSCTVYMYMYMYLP